MTEADANRMLDNLEAYVTPAEHQFNATYALLRETFRQVDAELREWQNTIAALKRRPLLSRPEARGERE